MHACADAFLCCTLRRRGVTEKLNNVSRLVLAIFTGGQFEGELFAADLA